MKNPVHYIILCCVFLAILSPVQAQVLIKASLDKDRILIGEPVQLLLDLRAPLGASIDWASIDTIPHFEILERGKVDTIEGVDGKKVIQQLTLTSFDSGQWVIPRLSVKVNKKSYLTDTVGLEVAYTPFNPEEDYRDIKEIIEVPNPSMSHIPWIIAGGTLIAIALIVYLLWPKKKIKAEVQAVPQLTPYEEAMQSLDQLQKSSLQQNGEIKKYYTQLNDVLRVFVMRKLKIASLEKTNEELIMQLKQLPMEKEQFRQLSEALQIADFVKFARYQPERADNERNFNSIRTAITTLNNIT